jgi:hypothetical protein
MRREFENLQSRAEIGSAWIGMQLCKYSHKIAIAEGNAQGSCAKIGSKLQSLRMFA